MSVPPEVRSAWGWDDAELAAIPGGLINATFGVRLGGTPVAVLQRLHPIFAGTVNLDLAAVTTHLAARGVVFGLIGLFLIQAALQHNPEQAGGLDEALQALARQGHGRLLLGVVAVGLVAYGSYMLLIAWYRRHFIT